MYPDLKDLLSVLNENGVKYLVVGGYAVSLYSEPRANKDLDIFIKADPENAGLLYAALARFGAPLEGLTAADFAERGPFLRMGREPVAVDILTEIPGVDFDEAWVDRVEHPLDPTCDWNAHFISRKHLVEAKLAAGRPQDLADVAAIRRAGDQPAS
jgi:hypothetical protein